MTKRPSKAQTKNTEPPQGEAYGDTWVGRGQELQDQEDMDAGRLEREGTPENTAPESKSTWAFPTQTTPEPSSSPTPTLEEQEEMAARQRWTVGRNNAFADLRAKATPPKPDPTDT
jgi:hypothetical protein